MDAPGPWPVRVAAVGPVAVGTTLWRQGGQLHVTAIVKATFRLAHNRSMSVIAPDPIRMLDQYVTGAPPSSLSGMRETAPKLRQAEVVLFGHGYAPRSGDTGQRNPVVETTVRLRVGRQNYTWLDKSLRVMGDRRGDEPPAPFEQIPICYERALGGPSFEANPIGAGVGAAGARSPNLLSPDQPDRVVACYSPLPAFFPSREQIRGRCASAATDQGMAEIPSDVDWRYFHAAPSDQRIHSLRPGDWVLLTGLSPVYDTLRSVLPSARAVTTIFADGAARAPSPTPMVADQLILEPDHGKCAIVWRCSIPVSSPAMCRELVIAGALERQGEPIQWPADRAEAARLGAPPPVDVGARMATSFDDSPTLWKPNFAEQHSVSSDGEDLGVTHQSGIVGASEQDVLQEAIRGAIARQSAPLSPTKGDDTTATRVVSSAAITSRDRYTAIGPDEPATADADGDLERTTAVRRPSATGAERGAGEVDERQADLAKTIPIAVTGRPAPETIDDEEPTVADGLSGPEPPDPTDRG